MNRTGSTPQLHRTPLPPRRAFPSALLLGWLWAALLLLPAAAQSPVSSGTPATPGQYVAALQDARRSLLSADGRESGVEEARASLQPLQQVRLLSGEVVELDPLLGETGRPLDAAEALARVETVLAQLQAAEGDASAERLAVLESVLAGPQFVGGESWWDLVLQWLSQWLDRFLPSEPRSAGSSQVTEQAGGVIWWGIGIAGAVALVLLLAYWLRGFLGNFIGAAELESAGDSGDLPQSPAEARRRAAGLAAGGDYRNAVRNLYLSALLTLEQNGLVPADRSLTNRELLRRVPPAHPVAGRLQPVVDIFDDVWYGVHEPGDQTYSRYTQEIDALETLAQQQAQEPKP